MEVGAVKQAFNNELILLKKKLSQAKIQIIHKLTRKAKTFVETKAPEPLKEKLKRKAESAVNEVLIIKKIKPRDIGKFILTHKGKLQDYLNKPQVDQEKACARLLLHKSMQDKCKFIRSRFSGVPINDLFMSRAERQKMKKEAREKQKEKLKKKKGKDNVVNSEGDWNVEDVDMSNNSQDINGSESEIDISHNEDVSGDDGSSEDGGKKMESGNESDEPMLFKKNVSEKSKGSSNLQRHDDKDLESKGSDNERNCSNDGNHDSDEVSNDEEHFAKLGPEQQTDKFELKIGKPINKVEVKRIATTKNSEKKQKDTNKKKNFNEKILNRKFKKDLDDTPQKEVKVVDPFFITSTGENYMSLAEPRAPDEVKEFHKEGNRKLRRAIMFGYVPKVKPRQEFNHDNDRFNRRNGQNSSEKRSGGFDRQNQRNDRFNRRDNFGSDNFGNNDRRYKNNNFERDNDKRFNNKDNFEKDNFKDNQRTNFKNKSFERNEDSAKTEKLHPSWEAKKKQSGILPFQGKKVVFNDD